MKKWQENNLFLSEKRYFRNLKRTRRKKRRKQNVYENYESIPITLLSSACNRHWSGSNKISVHMNKQFTVIENPCATIDTFLQFAEASRSRKIWKIQFDHSDIENVDLAAESILDFIATEMRRETRSRRKKIEISGKFPNDKSLTRFLRVVGIIKNLGVKHEYLSKNEEGKLEIFQARNKKHGSKGSASDADYKDIIVRKFVDHVDKCLATKNKLLTPAAKGKLVKYTGEIIDNVEEHTDIEDWTIVGYLDTLTDNQVCEIAIYNFGKTIAESFMELAMDSYARSEVQPYVERHRKSGFFTENWSEEDLLTLIALQGKISSKNKNKFDDRGNGTIELINFFQQIHAECSSDKGGCAKMSILSGKTHIFFDGKYSLIQDDNGRNIIAFNAANDLNQLPDKKYITNLGDLYFPGTTISIKFPLGKTNLPED